MAEAGTREVLLTQPYVPAYRVPLFDAIAARLAARGLRLVVAHGMPEGRQLSRGDAATAPWSRLSRERTVRIGARRVKWRSIAVGPDTAAVVTELEALNTFAWSRALRRRPPLVLWGHGRPYVNDAGRLADALEAALARRADAVLTYAPGGREHLVGRGRVHPGRVTAIGNSTDTAAVRNGFLAHRGRTDGDEARHRAVFVGGLDHEKRIDFLLAAADHAARSDPLFRLVMVGDGELAPMVEAAMAAGAPVAWTRAARGADLGRVLAGASLVWMPGRIGLVAADAVAAGLPVATTVGQRHAPEVEFLREGELLEYPDDAAEFARESLAHLRGSPLAAERPLRDGGPTLDSVADRFVDAVLAVIDPLERRPKAGRVAARGRRVRS